MITNLDIIQRYFKNATFERLENINLDGYDLKNGFTISHIEGESFSVDYNYFDFQIGYVTDSDLYLGNLTDCLDYVLKNTGSKKTVSKKDKQDYLKVVQNENY